MKNENKTSHQDSRQSRLVVYNTFAVASSLLASHGANHPQRAKRSHIYRRWITRGQLNGKRYNANAGREGFFFFFFFMYSGFLSAPPVNDLWACVVSAESISGLRDAVQIRRKSTRQTQAAAAAAGLFLGRCVWCKFGSTNGSIRMRLRGISVRHDRHCYGVPQVQPRFFESHWGCCLLHGYKKNKKKPESVI